MNTRIVLAFGVVAAIVVLAGGAFVMTKNNSTSTKKTPTTAAQQESNQKSLKDLITSGESQKCEYKDKISEADVSGTVYVSGGKMRSDYVTTTAGQAITGHMIAADNKMYMWMDGQSMGYSMAFNPKSYVEPTGSETVDLNKYIDYNCSGWSVDNSVFTPPATIKFSAMGTVSPSGVVQPTGQGASNQCAACNYLTGDDKTKCMAALKCN